MDIEQYTRDAVVLLCDLISIPSFSKEEDQTADALIRFLDDRSIPHHRIGNNILCKQEKNEGKPILVLNSHHDTVKPAEGWTVDPFTPIVEGESITGLGSNDAGGCLVSLLLTFIHYYDKDLPFQLHWIASAEEEISGKNGLRLALEKSGIRPAFAIVGEPTQTNLAVAEKGLMVIDAYTKGVAGHAAHANNDNALIRAVDEIQKISKISFDEVSDMLGHVKLTVTQIKAGSQHNVVPDACHFVIDCRINEKYTNQEVLERLKSETDSDLIPRSLHLNSSSTPITHAVVQRGVLLGKQTYGSPTLSDQVFFDCHSVKVGPGDSTRSHQADEFITISEIKNGIETYINLLAVKSIAN